MFFCKRICDQEKDCVKCSRNFLNDTVVNYFLEHHFTKVYVSNCGFTPEMSNLFLKNNILKFKLDILYSNNRYIDLVRSKKNRCMFFDSCNSPPAVCVIFLSILMCILPYGFIELIGCLEHNSVSNFYNKKDILKLVKEVSIQCILDILRIFFEYSTRDV